MLFFLMQPQTPRTPQVQATGSKTLFVGNLAFSVEQNHVYVYIPLICTFTHYLLLIIILLNREDFFKDAGEVAEVRFATDRDGTFKGFGHVEFTSVEAAQKVCIFFT